MARLTLAFTFPLLFLSLAAASSTKCFYPNGRESKTDFPCSTSSGTVCCPFNWQCLDNGLCYNPSADLLGRYTCNDKSWNSDGCPKFCDSGPSLGGAEAVLVCSDGRYCCDRNRQVGDCCEWPASNSTFFTKDPGNVFATVINSGIAKPTSGPGPSVPPLQTPSSSPSPSPSSSASSPSSSSSSPKPSSTQPPPPLPPPPSEPSSSSSSSSASSTYAPAPTPPPNPVTSTMETVVSSGTDGPHTIRITTVITTFPTSTSSSTGAPVAAANNSNRTNVIVGCAVGIPAGLALVGAAFFFVMRRRHEPSSSPRPSSNLSNLSAAIAATPRRLSKVLRRPPDDPAVRESMLHSDAYSEKYGPTTYETNVGPVDLDEQLHDEDSWTPVGRVYQNNSRRGSMDGPQFGIAPVSPRTHDPHMSWMSTSSGHSVQSPQTMWRVSGEFDNVGLSGPGLGGGGGSGAGYGSGWGGGGGPSTLAPPKRFSLGPGGLSPVHEEDGLDFSTGTAGSTSSPLAVPRPAQTTESQQPQETTPGGRYIPYRPPSYRQPNVRGAHRRSFSR